MTPETLQAEFLASYPEHIEHLASALAGSEDGQAVIVRAMFDRFVAGRMADSDPDGVLCEVAY